MSEPVLVLGAVVVALALVAGATQIRRRQARPFFDSRRDDERGNVFLDTPRMWADFVGSVDRDIARELAGMRASGGTSSWDEHWRKRINAYRDSQDNAPKYVAYIVAQRRFSGLPELTLDTS